MRVNAQCICLKNNIVFEAIYISERDVMNAEYANKKYKDYENYNQY
jgi:hypothetical protein